MTARPLVSVIIPAYNVAEFVEAAIDSALAQTYPAVEIVVVDDGSTDGTSELLTRYRDRIVIVTQPNQGLAGARNSGIRASTGSLIALLDGDDLWLPERLDRLVGILDARPDLGLVTSEVFVMEGDEPTEKWLYRDRRKRPFPAAEADQIPEIACFNFLFIGVLFRRALMDECGMFTVGPRRGRRGSIDGAEDYELWTRFLLSGARAGFVAEPLGYYRVRPGSLSRSPHQALAHQAVLEMHLPALWKQGAKGYARDAYEIGTRLALLGERRAALPFFAHSLTGDGKRVSRAHYATSGLRRLLLPSELHRAQHDKQAATSETGVPT